MARVGPLAALLLAVCACPSESPRRPVCPPGSGEGAPSALFDPFSRHADSETPIPSDVWTVADPTTPNGIRLRGEFSTFDAAFEHLDGFGLLSPLVAPFLGVLDGTSISGTAGSTAAPRLFLLDLDGLGAPSASDFASRLVPVEMAVAQEGTALVFPFRRAIAMRPVAPLEPSRRYAMVVTSCIVDVDGRGIRADDVFAAVRDGDPIDAALEPTRAGVEPVLSYLEDPSIGLDRGSVALATVFTTQSITQDLLAMAGQIATGPAPALAVAAVYPGHDAAGGPGAEFLAANPGMAARLTEVTIEDYAFDAIGTIVVGTFDAPKYLDADEILARDPAGTPLAAETETLEFFLALPADDAAPGMSAPYPVVIFQHAMTVCKETAIAIADTLARFGIAVIGIDAVGHGSRSVDGPGTCETDAGALFDTSNFMKTTDRMRQTTADVLSLVRALKAGPGVDVLPPPGGDGVADLDVSRLAMIGQSYGGSITLLALSLGSDIGAGVCNVGGGLFSNLVIGGMIDGSDEALDLPSLSLLHIAMALGTQTVAESGDPLHFAPRTIRDPFVVGGVPVGTKSLLYQEAMHDGSLPNLSTDATVREMGIPLVQPRVGTIAGVAEVPSPVEGNTAGGDTAGLFQFDPAAHEFLLFSDDPVVMHAGQLQAAIFLRTWIDGGAGVIVDPFDAAQVDPYDPGNLPWSVP